MRRRQQLEQLARVAAARAAGKAGGNLKVGIVTPTAAINPVTVADQGGLDMLGQTGEYLAISNSSLQLVPVLAESWTANSDSTIWTFKIRQGVKFHNGQPLTADDVVYTYKLQTDPKGSANALSAFGGVLVPSGVQKVDSFTVAFHLEAPNGNFPYLTSSDNYNMIILPNNYDPTKWESSFIGTGPFKLQELHAQGGRVVRPQRRLLGHEGPARQHRLHVLRRPSARACWRCRAGRSTSSASSRSAAARRCSPTRA